MASSSGALAALAVATAIAALCAKADITVENRRYSNIVVAISPDTPSTDENQDIIDGIKEWITAGNEKLHAATKETIAIGHVAILIPSNWTDIPGAITSQTTFDVRN